MQIANVLAFLGANNYNYIDVPYDSTIYIELYYNEQCVNITKSEDCFSINVRSNGTDLTFDACKNENGDNIDYCSYKKFSGYMNQIMVPVETIDTECLEKW
jgi:hypothetical protein